VIAVAADDDGLLRQLQPIFDLRLVQCRAVGIASPPRCPVDPAKRGELRLGGEIDTKRCVSEVINI
jgi:hypothetical protein